MVKKFFVLFFFIIFTVLMFSFSYHAYRFVIEYTKDKQYTRYEEVYYKDGDKIVFVKIPRRIIWVKLGDKYYMGTSDKLKLCPPIKDLEDIFLEYANSHGISLDFNGEITISEKAFTLKALKIDGLLRNVIRKFEDVITEMQYIYTLSNYTFNEILQNFKFIDKSEVPQSIYNIFNLFLWFNVEYEDDVLKVYAIDKDGENILLEISDKSGDYQVGEYYLTILESSDKTREEILNEISSNS